MINTVAHNAKRKYGNVFYELTEEGIKIVHDLRGVYDRKTNRFNMTAENINLINKAHLITSQYE